MGESFYKSNVPGVLIATAIQKEDSKRFPGGGVS
jgi:hypothetical protein